MAIRFAEEIPVVAWDDFLNNWKWKQGEHLMTLGPTGRGKSTLIEAIMYKRGITWVFVTKKTDPIVNQYKKKGFVVRETVKGISEEVSPKVVLKPKFAKEKPKTRIQFEEFEYALDRAFEYGGVCIVIEEGQYIAERLKLAPELKDLWHQGRSLGVSLVIGIQRPAHIPVIAYSSSTHVFMFQSADMRDLERLGGISGVNNLIVREAVSMLKSRQVLYVNTLTGEMVITKVTK